MGTTHGMHRAEERTGLSKDKPGQPDTVKSRVKEDIGRPPPGGERGPSGRLTPGGGAKRALDRGGPDLHIVYPHHYAAQSSSPHALPMMVTTTRMAQSRLTITGLPIVGSNGPIGSVL